VINDEGLTLADVNKAAAAVKVTPEVLVSTLKILVGLVFE
jgi:hypothetical protein